MPAQIGYFDTLKSVAGKVFTYLASITLTGTDGKTITVTQDTSLDEAVAMSDKAPKASPAFTTKITTPIIDLTGGQIAFPAAQAASADANTLDDYEEETWTLTLTCGTSGTVTLNASYNTGYYTKIGNRVFIHGIMIVASVSSPVGTLLMSLPFTSNSVANCQGALAVSANGLESTAVTQLMANTSTNSNVAYLKKFAAGVSSGLSPEIKAGAEISFCGSYII
uniref:Uncharacterized protein n=1 Tax=viral metagenome TaxID=1070528 RepID=A0A6H1ZYV4_9ZZZZ